MREDHASELRAIQDNTWPRDINDYMRWVGGQAVVARVCQQVIDYLDELEVRVNRGDLDLLGYE